MVTKKRIQKDRIALFILYLIITGGSLYYVYFFTPKNSLELYQKLHFADSFGEAQKLILDGYEGNFKEEDFDYIQGNIANSIGQFTIFEFNNKSYVIMTSPGTERLKVLAVEELPNDIRKFFLEVPN